MSIKTPLGQDLAATEASGGKRRSRDPLLVTRSVVASRIASQDQGTAALGKGFY